MTKKQIQLLLDNVHTMGDLAQAFEALKKHKETVEVIERRVVNELMKEHPTLKAKVDFMTSYLCANNIEHLSDCLKAIHAIVHRMIGTLGAR